MKFEGVAAIANGICLELCAQCRNPPQSNLGDAEGNAACSNNKEKKISKMTCRVKGWDEDTGVA